MKLFAFINRAYDETTLPIPIKYSPINPVRKQVKINIQHNFHASYDKMMVKLIEKSMISNNYNSLYATLFKIRILKLLFT